MSRPYPPSLTTYLARAADLAQQAALDLHRKREELDEAQAKLVNNMSVLERRTEHFLRFGWADLRERHYMPIQPYLGAYGHPCWDWEQYFRAVASEAHRPFIYVYDWYHTAELRIQLYIPKRKSLRPLSVQFLLLDQKLHAAHNTVTWRWRLSTEMFDEWALMLRTDPDMQRALEEP